eukprot:gnl/TRDRNA2_/TRDRNA2_64288_c0_seq1.p1 gnl/TRDRNA2_/TRDRNA2_64288_c0~~gnl/TRDRNA2_/TRDRNA2_64288_c0_seq1.p1  ORF type:complete len:191 (-),score=28.04 gnl/TRDRNA2_/TRDRNA2_64288_c0_seq1:199-771(-)
MQEEDDAHDASAVAPGTLAAKLEDRFVVGDPVQVYSMSALLWLEAVVLAVSDEHVKVIFGGESCKTKVLPMGSDLIQKTPTASNAASSRPCDADARHTEREVVLDCRTGTEWLPTVVKASPAPMRIPSSPSDTSIDRSALRGQISEGDEVLIYSRTARDWIPGIVTCMHMGTLKIRYFIGSRFCTKTICL